MALVLGPDTKNPIQDRGSLVKISLPYDLRPMGINDTLVSEPQRKDTYYSLVSDTLYSNLTEIDEADCVFEINMEDANRPDGTSYKKFALQPIGVNFTRSIKIDRGYYDYSAYVGEGMPLDIRTHYWPIYKFKKRGSSKEICVMFRILNSEVLKSAFVSEAIIHHTLQKSTQYKTHEDCQYVPDFRVYRARLPVTDTKTGSEDDYDFGIYIIDTVLEGTYENILDAGVGDPEGAEYDDVNENGISTAVIQVARKLDRLYELYKFNHGNLSPNSIVYVRDSSGKKQYLLNNFMLSSLQFDTNTESKYLINMSNTPIREDIDLTTLITHLKGYKDAYQAGGYLYNFGIRLVSDSMYGSFYMYNNLRPWDGIHIWLSHTFSEFDSYVFKDSIPIHVLSYYNQGPDYITGAGECDSPMIKWTGPKEHSAIPLTRGELILKIVRRLQLEAEPAINIEVANRIRMRTVRGRNPSKSIIDFIKNQLISAAYKGQLIDAVKDVAESEQGSPEFNIAYTDAIIAKSIAEEKQLWKKEYDEARAPILAAEAAAAAEAARPKPMPLKYKIAAGVAGATVGVAALEAGVRIVASQASQLIASHPLGAAVSVAALTLYGFWKSSTRSSNRSAGGFIRYVRNKKKHSTRRRPKKIIRVKKLKQTKRHRNHKKAMYR
jgi:hypothetical protein